MNQKDYHCGVIDAFNEMVANGVKQLALSHPFDSSEERKEMLPFVEAICAKYHTSYYLEDRPLISDLFPAAVNKDGSLSKKSSTASMAQFNQLFKFVQKTSMRMGKQILDGCIDVNPYKRGSRGNACTYCKYRAVCGFDESVEGYQFRHLMEMSAEKLWETISKEVAADGHDVD